MQARSRASWESLGDCFLVTTLEKKRFINIEQFLGDMDTIRMGVNRRMRVDDTKYTVLAKQLEKQDDGRQYVGNLEKVVDDLLATGFHNGVELYQKGHEYKTIIYKICYGTDGGGKKVVGEESMMIGTLPVLMREIRKAKEVENPDFKIGLVFLQRVYKIGLSEEDSSTKVFAFLYDSGNVRINFIYDGSLSNCEAERKVHVATRKLIDDKGYTLRHSTAFDKLSLKRTVRRR